MENKGLKVIITGAIGYRPGFMKPLKGQIRAQSFYKFINWLMPLGRKLFPEGFNTIEEVGLSMIRLVRKDYEKPVLRGRDISLLAKEMQLTTTD